MGLWTALLMKVQGVRNGKPVKVPATAHRLTARDSPVTFLPAAAAEGEPSLTCDGNGSQHIWLTVLALLRQLAETSVSSLLTQEAVGVMRRNEVPTTLRASGRASGALGMQQ